MPIRHLPGDADLERLRSQAKTLQRRARAGDEQALALLHELHPRPVDAATLKRSDAQLVIARMYGLASWPKLVRHVETITRFARSPHREPEGGAGPGDGPSAEDFLRLACLRYGGDDARRVERARELLAAHPELAGASIYTAAAVGDVAAARDVLARDPEAARREGGPFGWEPLLYAAYARVDSAAPGHSTLEVARLLLQHGADPHAGFLWEGLSPPFTALTGAFGGGEDAVNQPPHQYERELAELLLRAGADPNDEQALYNRQSAASDSHLETLFPHGLGTGDGGPWHRRLAPRHASPRQMLEDHLVFASAHDLPERVELLLRHGVDPDGRGTSHPILRGRNAIELALANGSERIVAALTAAGATAPPRGPEDELLDACMRGDTAEVERRLEADPSLAARAVARDADRLRKAAELGRPDAVRLLVRIGFDVDDRRHLTALHEAAFHGHRAIVDLLLELGADPTLRDTSFGTTPAAWARHSRHDELAAYLEGLEA